MREGLTERDMMPFGVWKGMLMKDVPKEYLAKLADDEKTERRWPDVVAYAQRKTIEQEPEDGSV